MENQGRRAGRRWATNEAEYGPLKHVAALPTEWLEQAWQNADGSDGVDEQISLVLYEVFRPVRRPSDSLELALFFGLETDVLEISLTTEYVEGFAEGAREVWAEVVDKL